MATPVLPAPTPSAPAPARAVAPMRQRGASPLRTVVAALLAVALAALFNADDLLARARSLPFGWQRTAAVDVATRIHTVASTLLLDRPRVALDRLFGHERGKSVPAPPVNGTKVVPFRPTATHPVRIYLGGDSVAQAFADGLRSLVAGRHDVVPTVEYRFATGLTRPDYFDWPARLRTVLGGRDRPQIVILLFGANDMQPIMTPSGPAAVGTERWLAEYRTRVAATMTMLAAAGVDTYWVGQPVMKSAGFDRRIAAVDEIYAGEAARHPGIRFIDSRALFSDTHGRYSAYLPDAGGRPVLVRAADGVHFTDAGGRRLAGAVLAVVEERWPLAR